MRANGKIMGFEKEYGAQIDRIRTALESADAVMIGAGAGLSSAAGFPYGGARFLKYFADFHAKYGIADMYSGGFYAFETSEEFWAWWSRHIFYNRYADPPGSAYRDLYELVKHKEYFVLTTNVDHCFQKAGFDKKRLFYTQGDYGLFQCSIPCCDQTYDNEEQIRRMVAAQRDMKIPSELIPYCPVCGKPMTVNLRSDGKFVEDGGWRAACERYAAFLDRHRTGRVVYLELGVGGNTPGIIKYPFWKRTAQNPHALYVCGNYGEAVCPKQLERRSICLNEDIATVLSQLKNKIRTNRIGKGLPV